MKLCVEYGDHLLVDDIHPEHTERIKLLKGTGATIEAKVAFGHPVILFLEIYFCKSLARTSSQFVEVNNFER